MWQTGNDLTMRTGFLRLSSLVSFLLVASVGLPQAITAEQKDAILKGVEEIVTKRAFVPGIDFSKWTEFVAKRKEDLDKATEIPAFTQVVNRVLREFGLTHISLRTPRAAVQRTQTSIISVGLSVRKVEEGLRVVSVSQSGPAKDSGISQGDVIIEVDGKAPTGPEVLTGDEGTKVSLKVKKEDGTTKEVQLSRQKISTVRPEQLTWPNPETAVLRIFTFSTGYSQSNIEKLMTDAAKAKYLILDLRNNGGGATNNMMHLLGLLLPPNSEVGTFINRTTAEKYATETKAEATNAVEIAKWAINKSRTRLGKVDYFKGKIAVLINRGSASASEIVSAALRDVGGAKLFGTKSAGAVLASVYGRLPEGFQIQYPISDYVTIKGVRLEGNPLVPDVEVIGTSTPENDLVIAKAIETLTKG